MDGLNLKSVDECLTAVNNFVEGLKDKEDSDFFVALLMAMDKGCEQRGLDMLAFYKRMEKAVIALSIMNLSIALEKRDSEKKEDRNG